MGCQLTFEDAKNTSPTWQLNGKIKIVKIVKLSQLQIVAITNCHNYKLPQLQIVILVVSFICQRLQRNK